MTTIDRLSDRYQHDAVFAKYVDMMRLAIRELHLEPGELRDAAMLACYIEITRLPPESLRVVIQDSDVVMPPKCWTCGSVYWLRRAGRVIDVLTKLEGNSAYLLAIVVFDGSIRGVEWLVN